MLYEKIPVVLLKDYSRYHRFFTKGAIGETWMNRHWMMTTNGLVEVISVTIKNVTIEILDSPEDYIAYGSKEDMKNNIPYVEPLRKVRLVFDCKDANGGIYKRGTVGLSDMRPFKQNTMIGPMNYYNVTIDNRIVPILSSSCRAC